ncbi:MAG TPA: M28 family peptidase, partial [Solirubrobacteraceae bacterium]|nr:M28 family peptidase [Solirubrobacteraceae bacterium]
MAADPARLLGDLRSLAALTATDRGAQRVAWTDTWARAREWERSLLAELPVEVEVDEAGNMWAVLPGERAETLILGSHIDSVPDGGWLDGALGLLGGLEVLRGIAAAGRPPLTVKL